MVHIIPSIANTTAIAISQAGNSAGKASVITAKAKSNTIRTTTPIKTTLS